MFLTFSILSSVYSLKDIKVIHVIQAVSTCVLRI